MAISELLKQFQEHPDQLDLLAKALNEAEELEKTSQLNASKIEELQESNRKLLKMVNIKEPSQEPGPQKEEPTEPKFDLDSAVDSLLNLTKEG